MIERLKEPLNLRDYEWERLLIDKINEIIDWINSNEQKEYLKENLL